MTELTIGEFSKATGLTVKALRFYHDRGVLIPQRVDVGSGYRYYGDTNFETARTIVSLRELGFSVEQIKQVLCNSELTVDFLEQRKAEVAEDIALQEARLRKLNLAIKEEKTRRATFEQNEFQIERRQLKPMLIGGIRMKGRYPDMGEGFGTLGRRISQHIAGPGQCLYYDEDHRDDDADFEPFFPLRKSVEVDGISVRELAGGAAICLRHRGPYEDLGRSYAKLFAFANEHGLARALPSREVYLKGPSFRGKENPGGYLTEIQFMVETV